MRREAPGDRGGIEAAAEVGDQLVGRDRDEQAGPALVRGDPGHRQRNAFLIRPKKPPSSSSSRYGSSPSASPSCSTSARCSSSSFRGMWTRACTWKLPSPPPLDRGHALPAQDLHVARLGAGRNLDLDLAARAGNRERRAERRLRHRQLDGGVEIVSVALDARLRPDADLDEEVAGRAAELAGVPLAADADPLPVGDAGGDVDVERPDRATCARGRRTSRTAFRRRGRAPRSAGRPRCERTGRRRSGRPAARGRRRRTRRT